MEAPDVHYARSSDDAHIAYSVVGNGPVDLVLVPTWFNNIDLIWDVPQVSRFFERMAGYRAWSSSTAAAPASPTGSSSRPGSRSRWTM